MGEKTLPTIKTTDGVKTYFVRNGWEWGYFFIHTSGLFVAHTDFGTYGYHWPAQKWDFLEFLAKTTDMHYILSKISRRDYLDDEKTEKQVRKHILQMRRERALDKDRARELWDDCEGHDQQLMDWVMEQPEFCERDGYEWAVHDYPPSAWGFIKELFPILQAQLREEIAQRPVVPAQGVV